MDKQTEKLIDRWLFHAAKSGDLKLPLGRAAEKPEVKEVKDEKGAKGKKKFTPA